MKKILAFIFLAITIIWAANTKSAAKFGEPASNQPQDLREFEYENRVKFNLVIDDLDTIFNHLGGLKSDSIGKSTGVFDLLVVDSADIGEIDADSLYADTANIADLVSALATITTAIIDSAACTDITSPKATITTAILDSAAVVDMDLSGYLELDSLIVDQVPTAVVLDSCTHTIKININGTTYRVMVVAE